MHAVLGRGKNSTVIAHPQDPKLAIKLSRLSRYTRRRSARLKAAGRTAEAKLAVRRDAANVGRRFDGIAAGLRAGMLTPHLVASAPCRVPTLTPGGRTFTHASVMERARCDLVKFSKDGLLKTDKLARRLIFQVLWTLAALQRNLGRSFRHNDSGLQNILVRRTPAPARKYVLSKRYQFCLPAGIDSCLSDFDFVNCGGDRRLSNSRVGKGGRYDISATPNLSYDARLFLTSFRRHADAGRLPATARWLHSLNLGSQARSEAYSRHLEPRQLLKSKFFAKLRKHKDAAECAPRPSETYAISSERSKEHGKQAKSK